MVQRLYSRVHSFSAICDYIYFISINIQLNSPLKVIPSISRKSGFEKSYNRRDGGDFDESGLDEEAMKNMPNTVGPNPNIYGGFPENDIWGNFELPAPETLDKLKQALGSHGSTGNLF